MLDIIHISNNDIKGGAARAAYRIHRCIKDNKDELNIDSSMKVVTKYSDDPSVHCFNLRNQSWLWKRLQPRISKYIKNNLITNNYSAHNIAFPNTGALKELNKNENNSTKKIIHMHWLGDNTISIEEIAKLKSPIFWTLHDQWAFCGAEHYTHPPIYKNGEIISDTRYCQDYSKPSRSLDEKGFDLNRWTWMRKKKYWKTPFNIIVTSNWMFDCVKNSSLMSKWPIYLIPYPIDINKWKPINKLYAKKILGVDPSKKIILYGAIGGTKDKRKGAHLLNESLKILKNSFLRNNLNKIQILVFGESKSEKFINELPIKFLGNLNDDISLQIIYSAAEVMVVPSIQEAFGQTASEAHACGTPVVSFRIGGLIDIVSHKNTGFLADPYAPESLAYGINWVIEDNERNKILSKEARKKVVEKWDSKIIAKQYINAYRSAI